MSRKKVAVITPFMAQGGLEKVAVTQAQALQAWYDVTLVVFDTYKIDYPYEGKMIDLGIDFNNRSILKRLLNLFKVAAKLRKIKKESQFDLIIVHGELANIPAVFSGEGNHIVVIHENSFAAVKDYQGKLFSRFSKKIYSSGQTKKIVTVSQGIEEVFQAHFGFSASHLLTIHNPMEIAQIKKMAAVPLTKYQSLFEHEILITVGRLTEAKGHSYLLRIFQAIKQKRPELKLVLLGDGELRDATRNDAASLGLKVYSVFENDPFDDSYDLYFLGFHANPYQYVGQSKLFIMSSIWEGFGNTIVESMASGTPVISTDCESGPREIIAPEHPEKVKEVYYASYGAIAPAFESSRKTLSSKTTETWCRMIEKLLDDHVLQESYRQKGLQRATDFDTKYIIQEWKTLIEQEVG